MARLSILVSFCIVIAYLTSFANQVIIASEFGADARLSAYLLGANPGIALCNAIASILTIAFIPALVALNSNKDAMLGLQRLLLMFAFACGVVFVVIGLTLSNVYASFVASSFGKELTAIVADTAKLTSITVAIFILIACVDAQLNANKKFMLAAITTSFPYIGMSIAAIFWGNTYGPITLAYGLCIGYLVSLIVRMPFGISVGVGSIGEESWSKFRTTIVDLPLVAISVVCMFGHPISDAFWAPRISEIAPSHWSYAYRLTTMISSILGLGLSIVLLPRITECISAGFIQEYLRYVRQATRIIAMVGIPIIFYLMINSHELMRILFERGSFRAHDTESVANLLQVAVIGAIPYACVFLYIRSLVAMGKAKLTAMIAISSVVFYFLLSGLLSNSLGVVGISVAFVVGAWLASLWAYIASTSHEDNKSLRLIDGFKELFAFISCVIISVTVACLSKMITGSFNQILIAQIIIQLSFGVIIMIANTFVYIIFRFPEVTKLQSMLFLRTRN